MLSKLSKRVHIIIVVTSIILFGVQYILYYFNIINNSIFFFILKIEWFLLYIYALTLSIKYSGMISIYSIFLILSFTFNYSRIFLDLFTSYNIKYTDLFSRIILSMDTLNNLMLLIINFLLFSLLAFLIFYKQKPIRLKTNKLFINLGKRGIIFLFIPLIFIYLNELQYVWKHGYISLFNGDLAKHSSILSVILPRLIFFSFLLFLAGIPEKKVFLKYSYIYLIILFMDALKGQRGEFLVTVIFILWYYHTIYNIKFNIKKSFFIFIGILLFSQLLLLIRSNMEVNLLDIPYEFFRLNGISINVTAYLIEGGEDLESKGIPYLFSPIYDYFYRIFVDRDIFYASPSVELLSVSNNLSRHTMYYINSTAYFNGNGTGSSYLAEIYDFAGIWIGGIVMFLITAIVLTIENKLKNNRFILFIAPIILIHYIYMPRSSFFKFIDELFLLLIIYSILMILLKFRRKYHAYI